MNPCFKSTNLFFSLHTSYFLRPKIFRKTKLTCSKHTLKLESNCFISKRYKLFVSRRWMLDNSFLLRGAVTERGQSYPNVLIFQ